MSGLPVRVAPVCRVSRSFTAHESGDHVKPAAEASAPKKGNRPSPGEEDRLEGIFRVGSILQHSTANAKHHPPMPVDQGGE